jgi:hypothetical protein
MDDRRRLASPLLTPDYNTSSGGEFCSIGHIDSGGGPSSPLDRSGGGGGCYTNGLLVAESNSSCGGSFEHSSEMDPPPPPLPPHADDNDFIDEDDDNALDDDDDEVRLVAAADQTVTTTTAAAAITTAAAAAVKRLSGSNFGESVRSPIERSPSGEPTMHKRETIVSVDGGSAGSTRTATARVNFAPGTRTGATRGNALCCQKDTVLLVL